MSGVHCYDMLANSHLRRDLCYISTTNRLKFGQNDENVQNNLVRAVLGLAYFKDAESFQNWVESSKKPNDSIQ